MLNKNQYENIGQEIKNTPIGKSHNDLYTPNNKYFNNPIASDSNKLNQCYTQRENINNLVNKILKSNSNPNINPNYFSQVKNNKYYLSQIPLVQNSFYEPNNNPILEHQLQQLKLNYIALNNDNIIYREDINKLIEMNKKLEKELEDERNHNYDLAKENDKLNSDNQALFKKIDDVNQKISQIKLISQNEKEIMDKQIYFEEKINEKDLECKKILEDNNKLNLEYNLLNDKFIRLKEKNDEEEKELNMLKKLEEGKINDIEKKLVLLINEMNMLKNENNDLKAQNENIRNNIMNNEKEKNEYFNKYQEQKLKNDIINKEIEDIQTKYKEFQKNLEKKEEKKIAKENMRKNKSENKIKVIQDLQKRIQEYKTERAKNQLEE